MKRLAIGLLLSAAPCAAFAQQAPTTDQIDQVLSMARALSATELAVKDQRINALMAALKKAEEAACKPEPVKP